jgi:hypothetical protein
MNVGKVGAGAVEVERNNGRGKSWIVLHGQRWRETWRVRSWLVRLLKRFAVRLPSRAKGWSKMTRGRADVLSYRSGGSSSSGCTARGGPAVDWSNGVLLCSLFILRHDLHVLRCEAEEALVWIDSYASIKRRVAGSAVSVPSRDKRQDYKFIAWCVTGKKQR